MASSRTHRNNWRTSHVLALVQDCGSRHDAHGSSQARRVQLQLSLCITGFIHSATADFYLDWLEGMEGSDQDGAFGIVGLRSAYFCIASGVRVA